MHGARLRIQSAITALGRHLQWATHTGRKQRCEGRVEGRLVELDEGIGWRGAVPGRLGPGCALFLGLAHGGVGDVGGQQARQKVLVETLHLDGALGPDGRVGGRKPPPAPSECGHSQETQGLSRPATRCRAQFTPSPDRAALHIHHRHTHASRCLAFALASPLSSRGRCPALLAKNISARSLALGAHALHSASSVFVRSPPPAPSAPPERRCCIARARRVLSSRRCPRWPRLDQAPRRGRTMSAPQHTRRSTSRTAPDRREAVAHAASTSCSLFSTRPWPASPMLSSPRDLLCPRPLAGASVHLCVDRGHIPVATSPHSLCR